MVNFQNRKQGRTQRRRATDVLEKLSSALTLASIVKQRGISNIPASASKAREKVPLVLSAGKRATGDKRGSGKMQELLGLEHGKGSKQFSS